MVTKALGVKMGIDPHALYAAQLPSFFCSWEVFEKGCGGGTTVVVYLSLPGGVSCTQSLP